MAPRIGNFAEWADHLLTRLRRQIVLTGDDELRALEDELIGYAGTPADGSHHRPDVEGAGEVAVPLRLRAGGRELAFLSTIVTFGTAVDITLAELSIEAFFPADEATAAVLQERL